MELTLSPDGNASACCISRSHVLGNVRQHRLDEIWRGERIKQFRATLQNYTFPSGCEPCEWSLRAGNLRTHPILSYDNLPMHAGVLWPTKIELAMSNTCNFACVMCSGDYSSVIRAQQGLPPMMERAWAFMRQGKQEEALEAALQTPPTDPLYYKALVLIAEIRIAMQDYERAEQALLNAVKLSPKHPEPYMRRAWLRYHQGRFADGLAELALSEERTRKVKSVDDFVLEQQLLVGAVLQYHTGHAEQALERIKRYLALRPDDGGARKLREDCLTALAQRPSQ